jgi:hypothetical protein
MHHRKNEGKGAEAMTPDKDDLELKKSMESIGDTPVAPAHGIAAIALHMALKYHDITTIKDGALYQQYKLEGKNFRDLHLDMVFETAMQMEAFLLGSSQRIAKLVFDAITDEPAADVPEEEQKP